ncbi:hypothetical protein C8R44DRAFT_848062 [Mycena epipterygia]|nr:hypothetical protein C8R44DRAFT_848062 [Mycena epipterygia]
MWCGGFFVVTVIDVRESELLSSKKPPRETLHGFHIHMKGIGVTGKGHSERKNGMKGAWGFALWVEMIAALLGGERKKERNNGTWGDGSDERHEGGELVYRDPPTPAPGRRNNNINPGWARARARATLDDAPCQKNSPASGGHGGGIANRFAYGSGHTTIRKRDRPYWADGDEEGGDKIKQSEADGIRRGSCEMALFSSVRMGGQRTARRVVGGELWHACRKTQPNPARDANGTNGDRREPEKPSAQGLAVGSSDREGGRAGEPARAGEGCASVDVRWRMQQGIASISGGKEGKEEKPGFNEGKRRRRRGGEEDMMNECVAWSRAYGVRAAGREGGSVHI